MACFWHTHGAPLRGDLCKSGTGGGWKHPVLVSGDEEYRHGRLVEQTGRLTAHVADAQAHLLAERGRRHLRDLRVELRERRLLARHALASRRMNAAALQIGERGRRAA